MYSTTMKAVTRRTGYAQTACTRVTRPHAQMAMTETATQRQGQIHTLTNPLHAHKSTLTHLVLHMCKQPTRKLLSWQACLHPCNPMTKSSLPENILPTSNQVLIMMQLSGVHRTCRTARSYMATLPVSTERESAAAATAWRRVSSVSRAAASFSAPSPRTSAIITEQPEKGTDKQDAGANVRLTTHAAVTITGMSYEELGSYSWWMVNQPLTTWQT